MRDEIDRVRFVVFNSGFRPLQMSFENAQGRDQCSVERIDAVREVFFGASEDSTLCSGQSGLVESDPGFLTRHHRTDGAARASIECLLTNLSGPQVSPMATVEWRDAIRIRRALRTELAAAVDPGIDHIPSGL